MAYFSDNFIANRRQQWLRSIHAVEVRVGSTWHRGVLNQKEVKGDTLLIKATFPTLDAVAATITASRVIDVRGEVAAYEQRTINKNSGQGTMIKIEIPLREVTA